MNRIFEGACRKLGLKKVQYKKREVCFQLKAMGLTGKPITGVDRGSANNAVEEMLGIWSEKDALNVILMVSASKGIRVKDRKGNDLLHYKIYNVANCALDVNNPEVFLFIAKQRDNTNTCHAFYCKDKFQAEAICLSMSNAFDKAFEAWVKQNGMRPKATRADESKERKKEIDLKSVSNEAKPSAVENQKDSLKCSVHAKRNFENGRRPSTLSEGSVVSFGSQADEVFSTLLSVAEEEEDLSTAALLRKDSYDWDAAVNNEKVTCLLEGEDVIWEDPVSEC